MHLADFFDCPKEKLHRFRVLKDAKDAQVEECEACGEKKIYRKDPKTGRIDNRAYVKDHLRDLAQPFGKTGKVFEELYGKGELKQMSDTIEQTLKRGHTADDIRRNAAAHLRYLERIGSKGF